MMGGVRGRRPRHWVPAAVRLCPAGFGVARGRDHAMSGADVPGDGELQIGSVRLPAGRRISAGHGSGGPVAWATTGPLPDAGRVWAALSQAHAQSGLVPFLLSGIVPGSTQRPWDDQEFRDPADVTDLDPLDAAALLGERWPGEPAAAAAAETGGGATA